MKRQERINISLISSPDSLQEVAAVPSSGPAGAPADARTASSPIDVDIVRTKVPRKPRTPRLPVAVRLQDEEEDEEVELTASGSGHNSSIYTPIAAAAAATMKRQETINISLISSPESLQDTVVDHSSADATVNVAVAAPSSSAVGAHVAIAAPSNSAVGTHSNRAVGAPGDGRTASSPIDVDIVRTNVPREPRTPRMPVVVCLEDEEEDEEVELTASRSGASREESSHSNTRKRQKTLAGITIINCEDLDENDSLKRQDEMKSAPPPPKESTFSCPICMHALEEASVTKCGHIFCEKCIRVAIKRNKKCPICAHKLTTRRGFHRIYFPASE